MYEGSREREVLGLDGVQANTRALFSMWKKWEGGVMDFSLLFLLKWKIKSKYHLLFLFSPLFKTIPSSNKAQMHIN